MLEDIVPFRYLPRKTREALRKDMREEKIEVDARIITQGDTQDDRVFVLLSGVVETLDRGRRIGEIHAGHYFGERAALFREPRRMEVRARTDCELLSLDGERFLGLLERSTVFAQVVGALLRDKHRIFAAFDAFMAELISGLSSGLIELSALLPFYKDLQPALHPKLNDEAIDFDALAYAVRRLPDNLTATFAYFLTQSLPPIYERPKARFSVVQTAARRRAMYALMPGKNLGLIRDGLSDFVDLISCLCLYVIEARKLRHKTELGEEEQAQLVRLWPGEAKERLRELTLHHEDIRIEVHTDFLNYNSAHVETWASQVARATRTLLGHDPVDLPEDLRVHIISSNTHSVTNCLSSWLVTHSEEILDWGKKTKNPMMAEPWPHDFDRVVAVARDFMKAHPAREAERKAADEANGILQLHETAFTGIGVQLIDTAMLDRGPGKQRDQNLIINIDYAFGEQAEHIIGDLLELFGHNLGSVNVLGKAGGLVGKRGDILVGTGFVDQTGDLYYPVEKNVNVARLQARLPDRGVHEGPVLTVAGTLLQNSRMLHFNRHIWGCVGLEMEGTYYFRRLVRAANCGLVRKKLPARFLYYISDLPLDHHSNLSGRMKAIEGLPPLYAITREILEGIFEDQPG